MAKVLILAAGEGTRLRPLTATLPKTLVPLVGKPLLSRQMAVLHAAGLRDVHIVGGHCAEALEGCGATLLRNADFARTNMVASLYCARALFDGTDDVLVIYGDIVYESTVLKTLLDTQGPVAVVVDRGWEKLWRLRMDAPLSDAETMRVDGDGRIRELGRKPTSLDDIEGQYIGMFKVSRAFATQFMPRYEQLSENAKFEGKSKAQMYMTSYLQLLIDAGVEVRAADITHGWLEVDSLDDLNRYETAFADGSLSALYDESR